jgi:hypothetical protein
VHDDERHHEPHRRPERLVRLISDGGGLTQPLAQLGPHTGGDGSRLFDGGAGRLGQGGLEALEHQCFQRNGVVIEDDEGLLDAAHHRTALAGALVEGGAQLAPAHLELLEGEYAETDADVESVCDPAADLIGDVVDVRHQASVGGGRRFAARRPE